jgi:hypothetical protein
MFLGGGSIMITEGINRGLLYKYVNEKDIKYMTVTNLSTREDMFFTVYEAIGIVDTTNDKVHVDIFSDEYKACEFALNNHFKPTMKVLSTNTNNSNVQYVYVGKYNESKPIINLFGFYFSWHLIPGLLCFVIGILMTLKPVVEIINTFKQRGIPSVPS